jgi:hypothetical protein
MRKLFLNLKQGNEDLFVSKNSSHSKFESIMVLNYLFSILKQFDSKIDILVLQIISNFLKDIDTIKSMKNKIEEYFIEVLHYFSNLISINFEKGKLAMKKENIFDDDFISIITNSLNILSSMLSHSDIVAERINEETSNENLEKLFENLFEIIIQIVISGEIYGNRKSETYEILILGSILNFINCFYEMNKDNEKNTKIDNFFLNNSSEIFKYYRKLSSSSEIECLIIFYSLILCNLSKMKIEILPAGLDSFMKSLEEFLHFISHSQLESINFYFIDKCKDLVRNVKDRLNFSSSFNSQIV